MAAPWQNTPQLEEYLKKIKPKFAIGIHDATLNEMGIEFAQKTLENITKTYNGNSISLKVGESIEL